MSEAILNDLAKITEMCLEKDKEIERLNNIINELEKYIEESYKYNSKCLSTMFEVRAVEDNKILDKIKELKENK
jgi:hypothetical protein